MYINWVNGDVQHFASSALCAPQILSPGKHKKIEIKAKSLKTKCTWNGITGYLQLTYQIESHEHTNCTVEQSTCEELCVHFCQCCMNVKTCCSRH